MNLQTDDFCTPFTRFILEPFLLYLDLNLCPHISIDEKLLWRHSRHRPAVEPFCGLRRHIDAAVAVRDAIVIVPVGAVEGDPTFSDIQHPWHTREVKAV